MPRTEGRLVNGDASSSSEPPGDGVGARVDMEGVSTVLTSENPANKVAKSEWAVISLVNIAVSSNIANSIVGHFSIGTRHKPEFGRGFYRTVGGSAANKTGA
jgi:hypothetical protein